MNWSGIVGIMAVVLIIAYLVAPGSQAGNVIGAFGKASAINIRALAGGVGRGGEQAGSYK